MAAPALIPFPCSPSALISLLRWLIPFRSLRLPHFPLSLAHSFAFSPSAPFLPFAGLFLFVLFVSFISLLRGLTFIYFFIPLLTDLFGRPYISSLFNSLRLCHFPFSQTYLAGITFLPFPFSSRVSHLSLSLNFDRPCSYSLFVLLVSLVSSFADIC